MHKFFVPKENIIDNIANICGEDVKHIYKVLRLKEGEEISINNCEGEEYLAKIVEITKVTVKAEILKKLEINNESPLKVYLFQGMPKAAKMDLIVQKSAELGVSEITPVIMERVVVKNEIGEFKKLDRLNRIAFEAAKQSKRSLIPKVNGVVEFKDMKEKLKEIDLILVPYENEEGIGLKNVINKIDTKDIRTVAIIIGPEGGFEEEEIEELKEIGAHVITLGPRILRTETAGFVCTALIMYELSDMGGKI
ncbi:16S rRNA (uracil(1498)-N(3))-methyltransferase [Clostridium hydrogenum]|uniref:16S rRNA (uracil(1498)-N(3))-methyltransferase n=1 Tax=Clostridium hydrogenum TaxID=2855764 RepID=UPI001F3F4B2D|nr:16S rRNA (uracil(1498)-N(3))-methyltransferase [Clostridium hydrogenum]